MAWRYRKSLRFPGGFKLNLSKSGFGYSWGFRGFRVGRDSRGRVVRTVSIPGTGIYNRQYLSGSKTQQQDSKAQNSGCGCGGCISNAFFLLLGLLFLGKLAESGNAVGIIVLVSVALVLYVIWQFRGPAPVTPPPNYEGLGLEVKAVSDTLEHGTEPVPEPRMPSASVATTTPPTSQGANGGEGLQKILARLKEAKAELAKAEKDLNSITAPAAEEDQHPLVDPQFQTATGLVTIDVLRQKTQELVESLETILKVELRKIRQSNTARDFVEQDIREVIVRLGSCDGRVSRYAAHLYLELFRYMHPKTYSGWTIDSVLRFCEQIIETNRETYMGAPKKLYTLRLIENFDAEHGTAVAKSTREALLIIGCFAASVDGKVSDEKAAEISRLKSLFEAVG